MTTILIIFLWIFFRQAIIAAAADDVLRCDVIHLVRDWPEAQADGFYRLTNESCDDARYPDHYYRKIDAPERYFYRLTSGFWMLYTDACDVNHIGVTNISTSRPWTTDFVNVGDAVTSISCVEYTEVITHPSTVSYATWSLPEFKQQQPYVRYTLDVELPNETESVSFYLSDQNGDCENGDISLFWKSGDDPMTLVTSRCFNNVKDNFLVKYPIRESRKSFRMLVSYDRSPDSSLGPSLRLDYFVHVEEVTDVPDMTSYPDTSVNSNGSGEGPLQDATATAVILDIAVTDYDNDTRTDLLDAPDPCEGITCYGGLQCRDGRCPCPTRQQCIDHHSFDPWCASNGQTYASLCHIRAERCLHASDLAVVSRGPCPPKSRTTGRPDAGVAEQTTTADPEIGAVTERTDWKILVIAITATIIIALALAVIIAVICLRRRATRQKSAKPTDKKPVAPSVNNKGPPKTQVSNNARRSRPFSRSSNASFRASPKSQPRLKLEIKPNDELDPDRFSLSGCITPLCDAPDNPLSTFTPSERADPEKGRVDDVQQNGSIPGVPERKPDADSGIQMAPDSLPDRAGEPADDRVQRRSNPAQRHGSATESKVYELELGPDVILDFDSFSDIDNTLDDSHLTTKL